MLFNHQGRPQERARRWNTCMETLRVTNVFHKHEEIQIQPSEQLERLKRADDLLHHQDNGPNGGQEAGAPVLSFTQEAALRSGEATHDDPTQ